MVTIPQAEYDRLRDAADDLADLSAYDRAKTALAAGEDELVPADYAKRLIAGEARCQTPSRKARVRTDSSLG